MHDHDFALLQEETDDSGRRRILVHIKAAKMTRTYVYDPATDTLHLDGPPLLVGGHDMTSIIGKRVREWLRGRLS